MSVLGSTSTAKVFDLHDLWQHCLVKVILESCLTKVSFEHFVFFILCVCVCVCLWGGRKKGRNLVVRGLCPRFLVHGGPNKYRFFCVTVPLYRIMYQISLPCIVGTSSRCSSIYRRVSTCIYTTWDHGLALAGRQGSSLSLKHGLCFGLFKLPTHSSTQDRARPLHLW